MFLDTLIIKNNNTIIRKIKFKKGLNLIIDETDTRNKTKTGNSVGKTTVIRLIDFCLAGNSKTIYSDPEFKKSDNIIEKFLTNEENDILIVLVLKEDLEDISSREIIIERNFKVHSQKIQCINHKKYNDKCFKAELNKLLFNRTVEKPTFRQIISKNIRHEKGRLDYVLKILDPYSKKEEYEALLLTWLGINVDDIGLKQRLIHSISLENNMIKVLSEDKSLSEIEQFLIVLDRDIKEKEKKIKNIQSNKDYEAYFKILNSIKKQINYLKTDIVAIKLRIDLINESKSEIESKRCPIDASNIKIFYDEANLLIPNLQKDFEDLLNFHEEMSKQKIDYITKELPNLQEALAKREREMSSLLSEEQTISERLNDIISSEDYNTLIVEINKLYERKGAISKQRDLIKRSECKITELNRQLKDFNDQIGNQLPELNERITKFNEFFSKFSSLLYGEKFLLSYEKKDDIIEFKISSVEGNLGTGKKKVQIAAFDLAYIKFAEYYAIPHLNFIIYDQIENIHNNQLSTLLINLVDRINCQYVVPVLKDKLPSGIEIDKYKILVLSQEDKLFKI